MDATELGLLVRQARKAAGLTLEDLAERVGLTPGALSHIESGRRLPSPYNAIAIAEALGIPAEDALLALDDAHRERRMSSLQDKPPKAADRMRASAPRAPSLEHHGYVAQDISALFADAPPRATRHPSASSASMAPSMRDTARWSDDTTQRLRALDRLADTAADAIRTLRGLLADEDPLVRKEARRLLQELDVRMPEE